MTAKTPVARLLWVTAELDALLRRVARHDVDAFAELYDHTRSRVFGLVTRVLRDPGYSEETTQDIYLPQFRKFPAFPEGASGTFGGGAAGGRDDDRGFRVPESAGISRGPLGGASNGR